MNRSSSQGHWALLSQVAKGCVSWGGLQAGIPRQAIEHEGDGATEGRQSPMDGWRATVADLEGNKSVLSQNKPAVV